MSHLDLRLHAKCGPARAGRASQGLRHTAASLLVAQGVPPRVVMEILGHSQIALTMNTYSHVAPEVSREAADRMAETLGQDDGDQADEPKVAELEDRQEDGG